MERYTNGFCKVYFAEFVAKDTNDKFYKIGHTKYKDAMDRFRYEPEQYNPWHIRILSTIICESVHSAKILEKTLHLHYPKNFWLEEKIVGVTEIVKLDRPEYLALLQKFRILNQYSKELLGYEG